MSEEELEVTESQPDLWPIREEEVAGAAVEGGWAGQREAWGVPVSQLLADLGHLSCRLCVAPAGAGPRAGGARTSPGRQPASPDQGCRE